MQLPLQRVNLCFRFSEHGIGCLLHRDGWVAICIGTLFKSQGYSCVPLREIADRMLAPELLLDSLSQGDCVRYRGLVFSNLGFQLFNAPLCNLHTRVILSLSAQNLNIRALVGLAGNLLDDVRERSNLPFLPGLKGLEDRAKLLL